jgi:Zn-dependent protease with chaperone function
LGDFAMPADHDRDNQDQSNPVPPADSGFRAIAGESRRRRGPADQSSGVTNPPSRRSPQLPFEPPAEPVAVRYQQVWRNADRAKQWQPLPLPDLAALQWAQLVTLLAIPLWPLGLHALWVSFTVFAAQFATSILRWSMSMPRYEWPLPGVLFGLLNWVSQNWRLPDALLTLARGVDLILLSAIVLLATPFWLNFVLTQLHGMRPWSLTQLGAVSPEAQKRLQAMGQRQGLPQLGLLPIAAPIAFTYGTLPKNARLVLSQGLLDQLNDDEIATICCAEVSQIHPLTMGLLSWLMALMQVPYLIYWLSAKLGDRWVEWGEGQDYRALEILAWIVAYPIAAVSAISYGGFWLLRWAGLFLGRTRWVIGDRAAVNATGNPNAQARALLKIAQGLSQYVAKQGRTDYLLEGFELLMPVGYRQALSLGSLLARTPVESALAWDWANPQRHWLTVNNSQALLGDRVMYLMRAAQTWQLPQEVRIDQIPAAKPLSWGKKLLAAAPFLGVAIGYGLAFLGWAIAWVAHWLNWRQLIWLGSDFNFFYGLPLLGFGVGTILRFNQYFPDLPAAWQRQAPAPADLAAVVTDHLALPERSQPTALRGQLLGRRGIANWLGQDLLLQTDQGLVRLHYTSGLGAAGTGAWNLRPSDWVGQAVMATGWLRRGATPWMDVECLRHTSGQVRRGRHQVWATVLAAAAIVIGLLWMGGLQDLIAVIQHWQWSQSLRRR